MIDYVYIGLVILFLIVILVVAKIEDGEDMKHKDEENDK